ncbi:hypothetical protein IV203_030474 [Nitzschia inconspicua]|uniref:Uncharacterized protein n=1 Tax=Nitzschia inconspicua TaxID=303405 RepID=A0A9K3P765_9STRA|nr:hypothetical protein IV203_030474 [Nitzschia inconspicua]
MRVGWASEVNRSLKRREYDDDIKRTYIKRKKHSSPLLYSSTDDNNAVVDFTNIYSSPLLCNQHLHLKACVILFYEDRLTAMTSTGHCLQCRNASFRFRHCASHFPEQPLLFRDTRRTISIVRTLSSWEAPSLPWLRYQESPVDLERLKRQEMVRRKWQNLEASLHVVITKYFQEVAFPNEFAIKIHNQPNRKKLLALNGFEPVPLPKSKDLLDLAEGVIVTPALPKELKQYQLFSQPTQETEPASDGAHNNDDRTSSLSEKKRQRQYPVFLEDDFTLYRILENQAALFLDHQYNAYRKFFEKYIDGPSKKIAAQIEASGLLNVFFDQPPATFKVVEPEKGSEPIEAIRHLNSSSGKVLLNEPKENLLVMSHDNDEVVLYEYMTPSVRITALPHDMNHSSASSMVHVSLVVFGALPLAYRSYNFALNYPGLSQTIAASVAFTITYGIWSHRVAAQTNQSRVVANALLHRVQARGDAVVFVLQEGAVRRLTQSVLHEYHRRWINSDSKEAKSVGISLSPQMVPLSCDGKLDIIKPIEMAFQLGLLVRKSSENEVEDQSELAPVSLDQALASLQTCSGWIESKKAAVP